MLMGMPLPRRPPKRKRRDQHPANAPTLAIGRDVSDAGRDCEGQGISPNVQPKGSHSRIPRFTISGRPNPTQLGRTPAARTDGETRDGVREPGYSVATRRFGTVLTVDEPRRPHIGRLSLSRCNRWVMACVFILLSTIGCATGYHPQAFSGGYSETRLAPDLFRVSFAGNGFTSAQRAYDFALLRAAELTATYGFSHFALVNENSGHSTSRYYNQFLQSYQDSTNPALPYLLEPFVVNLTGYSLLPRLL